MLFGLRKTLTEEQEKYINSIFDNQLTIVNARSGSGKTTLAVACAKLLGLDLNYVFSPVAERKLGYSPGTIEEKEIKYIQPLKDALLTIGEPPDKVIYREDN